MLADVLDALLAKRPYRDALPLDAIFAIMHQDAPHALDARCMEALEQTKLEPSAASSAAAIMH